jgi:hypothetical protein
MDAAVRRSGCVLCRWGELPIGDVMLSQKIALESSESRAIAVARTFVPDGTFRRRRLLR